MTDIKKRAERNGKVRRTIAQIEQTVAKLERMKKRVHAKSRSGKSARRKRVVQSCQKRAERNSVAD